MASPVYRDRQNSILEYTLQATQNPDYFMTQSTPDISHWGRAYIDIMDTPLISPGIEYGHEQFMPAPIQYNLPIAPTTSTQDLVHKDFAAVIEADTYSESSASPPESAHIPSTTLATSTLSKRRSSSTQKRRRPSLERKDSETSTSGTTTKRNHSCVERAYRERLNDKIDALASLLFFDSMRLSTQGTVKPSKCLVISRAKERIEQLEEQNLSLKNSVEVLKQQKAVMNHLLNEKTERFRS